MPKERYAAHALLRHHWGKLLITFLLLGGVTYGYSVITAEPKPEIITAKAVRQDLFQLVEAVGTITSERDLKLQFPISGVVAEVLVREGQHIEAGERLASLKAKDLQANVSAAYANLQVAQADLQELQEGARPEDLAIAQAEVENKRAALEAAQEKLRTAEAKLNVLEAEAEVAVAGELTTARSVITKQLTTANTSLGVVDDVLNDKDVVDAMTRNSPGMEQSVRTQKRTAAEGIQAMLPTAALFADAQEALLKLEQARGLIAIASLVVERLFSEISTLPATSAFTSSEREARKNDLSSEKNDIQDALSKIDTAIKSLRDASAGFNTKISAEEATIANAKADILTFQTSLRTQEAQLNLKKAGARATEIAAASARVRQAQADLSRTQADLNDTVLLAPSSGTITKVNIRSGELLSTAFQQEPAITMLGESPYRIEVYVSEIDVPKVVLSQTGSIELDAFPGERIALTVAEIDPAATDRDNVPKYRVKLDFLSPPYRLKIGMTGDTDIITGMREGVVTVPARAVLERKGSKIVRVLNNDGVIEEREVGIGLEGISDIEIINGIEEGEIVVVLIKK